MALTFVTALHDLARREPAYTARRTDDLLALGASYLLREPVALVIYTDPELVAPIEALRTHVKAETRVVALPLEDLPPWRKLARVRALREALPLVNGNPRKDVPGYTVLAWSKFDFLERTVHANPFRHAHFAWIDFGIGHVARAPRGGLATIAAAPTERVSLCSMRYVSATSTADRREFARFIRGHVCGGFFGGASGHVVRLVEACRAEIDSFLESGVAPNDEHVLSAVVSRRREELFRLYYGDYADVLDGYDGVRGARDLVVASHFEAARWHDFDAALDIGCALLDGPEGRDVEFWLSLFECAFAAGRRDVCERLSALASSASFPAPSTIEQALKLRVALSKVGTAPPPVR